MKKIALLAAAASLAASAGIPLADRAGTPAAMHSTRSVFYATSSRHNKKGPGRSGPRKRARTRLTTRKLATAASRAARFHTGQPVSFNRLRSEPYRYCEVAGVIRNKRKLLGSR